MLSRTDIIKRLQRSFSFYKKDRNYFESLIGLDIINLNTAYSLVLNHLKQDYNNLEMAWFIEQLQNKKRTLIKNLSYIINALYKFDIMFDINYLASLLKKYPELDEILSELFDGKDKINYDYLSKLVDKEEVINFLTSYTIVKGIYVDDIEEKIEDIPDKSEYYTTDSIRTYLREIGEYPILSYDEIVDYFQKIEEIKEKLVTNLSEEERKKLDKKYKFYRDNIITSNLRLVVSVAKKYIGRGLDFLDLIQEGNNGLMKAVEKFDYDKGYRFSTYAIFWIRQAIIKSIANLGNTIKIPLHTMELRNKIFMARKNLESELGRKVSPKEISDATGFDEIVIKNILGLPNVTLSIDAEVFDKNNDKGKTRMDNFLASSENVEDNVIQSMLPSYLNKFLESALNEREEKIIRMRYGIQEPGKYNPLYDREHNLEEISLVVGVTGERVRQIIDRILRKFRNVAKDKFSGYVNDENLKEEKKREFWDITKEDKELVLKILSEMSEKDRIIIWLRHGKNLDECNPIPTRMHSKYAVAMKKLQRFINNSNYIPVDTKINGRRNKVYLKEKLECSDEDIFTLAILLFQSEEYQFWSKYYGIGLSSPLNEINLSNDELQKLDALYPNLKEKLINISRPKFLKDILGASEEDITYILNDIKKPSLRHKVFVKLYGNTFLEEENNFSELTSGEKRTYFVGLERFRKKIDKKHKNVVSLKDILECSDEELANIMAMNKNSMAYKFMVNLFGPKFDRVVDLNTLDKNLKSEFEQIISYIRKRKKKKDGNKIINLKALLGVSFKEFMDYVFYYKLNFKASYYKLALVFGENLGNDANISESDEMQSYVSLFVANYQEYLANFLSRILMCSDDELDKIKESLNSELLIELQDIFGINLDKSKKVGVDITKYIPVLNNILNDIRSKGEVAEKVPSESIEILTFKEYETIESPFKHPFFKEFIKLLPLKCQLMTSLRLGIYDGNIHSVQEIAEIFNISEDNTLQELNKGINLFYILVSRYKELFNCEFPTLDGESELYLGLKPKNNN